MNNTPFLFSVLIANHNDGKYLECSINSILQQSYSNWEIIIVDDASDDNSKELYSKYQNDSRFHIYYNESQKGCGYTKRKCVEMANGEICGFVDADDAITDDALDIMVRKHIENPNSSLVYSKYYQCDQELNILNISDFQHAIPPNTSFLELRHGTISHFATFKKEYYLKTEGISPYFLIAEDHDLYYKLEEVGETSFIEKPLYYYRCNTGNNTSLGDKTIYSFFWDLLATYDACKRRNGSIEEIVLSYYDEIINDVSYNAEAKGVEEIKQTKEYKWGYYICKPLRKIHSFFSKK